VIDPNTGDVIFDLAGASPAAAVTPGVNWMSGCRDPRFPDGRCPLGTPGLIDAYFSAWKAYTRASEVAAAHFPTGPSQFEIQRSLGYPLDPDYKTPYSIHLNFGIQRELAPYCAGVRVGGLLLLRPAFEPFFKFPFLIDPHWCKLCLHGKQLIMKGLILIQDSRCLRDISEKITENLHIDCGSCTDRDSRAFP
jgi:hypothetical protein